MYIIKIGIHSRVNVDIFHTCSRERLVQGFECVKGEYLLLIEL